MKKITFQDVVSDLRCGREIEFVYGGKNYSITSSGGYWYFYCEQTKETVKIAAFNDKERLIRFVSEFCINGVRLSLIFDESRYEKSSLFIL